MSFSSSENPITWFINITCKKTSRQSETISHSEIPLFKSQTWHHFSFTQLN